MKQLFLLSLLSLVLFSPTKAQEITVQKVFGGYKFIKNDTVIPSLKDLALAVEPNSEAVKMAQNSKIIQTVASMSGLAGVGLLGYAKFGNTFHENNRANSNYTESILVWGASLLIISIPLFMIGNQSARKAAETYNESLQKSSNSNSIQLRLASSQNGVGLQLSF